MNYQSFCLQGRRTELEDAVTVVPEFWFSRRGDKRGWLFAGVYDGHGGLEVVERVEASLHLACLANLFSYDCEIGQALEEAYLQLDEECRAAVSGACAATVIVNEEIHWASAGDCGLVVFGKNQPTVLNPIHRVGEDPTEDQRIIQAGGILIDHRVSGPALPIIEKDGRLWTQSLMITRAIGDREYRSIGIIPNPVRGTWPIEAADRFLIAGTDGLFETISLDQLDMLARYAVDLDEFFDLVLDQIDLVGRSELRDNCSGVLIDLVS